MKLSKEQAELYHSHTIRNLDEIRQSQKCGCIACCSIYDTDKIEEWIVETDHNKKTALCAECGTDAVVGDAAGLKLNEETLKSLNKIWF